MEAKFFSALFLMLTIVTIKEAHCWCFLCPGSSPPGGDNITCNCNDAFYNPSTETCGNYIECTSLKSLSSDGLESVVHNGLDNVANSFISNAVNYITGIGLDFFVPNATKPNSQMTDTGKQINKIFVEASKDVDVIRTIIKKRTAHIVGGISHRFGYLVNPYLLKSSKLVTECNSNYMCVLQKLMGNKEEELEKELAGLLPGIVDQLSVSLDDVEVYYSKNCMQDCALIKTILDNKHFITEFLKFTKGFGDSASRAIVRNIMNMTPLSNELFNKALSLFGVKLDK